MLAAVTAVPLLFIAVLPSADVSGTDLAAMTELGLGRRIVYAVISVVFLAVPVAVATFARRMWLGWLLVALAASAVVFGSALWMLGIL